VAEVDAALLEVVGRHLDSHAVAGQRLDAVLLHPAGRIGHHHVAGVELHAIAGVGQDLGDEAFELQHFLFRHITILLNGRSRTARAGRHRGGWDGRRDA
jgi:hypothetical protein